MISQVYWTEEYPLGKTYNVSTELPDKVDFVIIGSGYTGLTAARVLAKADSSVAVFDEKKIGWGASSRNGGMATPGLKQDIFKIYKKYGMEYAREFWKASVDAIDLLENIIQEEKINCDWSRNGHIALACKQSHYDNLPEYANWIQKELGHKKTLVSKEEIHSEIGTNYYYGGLSDEVSGGLQPAKYVDGLARACNDYGVQLFENNRVHSIKKLGEVYEVVTDKGALKAKKVIVATNGYTDMLVPELKPKVFPVGSYIIVSDVLSEKLQKKLSPKGRMFYDSKWFINYFRLTPDGRMLWGGRNDLSTDLDLVESASILSRQVRTVFPDLEKTTFTHTWTGKLGITFDLMPHIGEVNGIHYTFGYGGHGLSIATYLGTEIGLLLSGQKKRSPFEEISHQTMFFYRKDPWFLPFAAKYYQFLDWIS
jgi:glycine/D-amino acid oxidase-like deaminating enzyme